MKFRPCIDLHQGKVKQIVGATFDEDPLKITSNHVSDRTPSYFANLYRSKGLDGGHVIKLGKGNDEAALSALKTYPGGLQIGGGINPNNIREWIDAGASKVILTSWLFTRNRIDFSRLGLLVELVSPERITLDLSCSKFEDGYRIMANQWRTRTEALLDRRLLERLSPFCSEFLIHSVDAEGRREGVDGQLLELLSGFSTRPLVYAGGVASWSDVGKIETLGRGEIDFTAGSSLDIFGGNTLRFEDLATRYA